MSRKIKDIVLSKSGTPEIKEMKEILNILMFKLLDCVPKHDTRTYQYYDNISAMISYLTCQDIAPLQ